MVLNNSTHCFVRQDSLKLCFWTVNDVEWMQCSSGSIGVAKGRGKNAFLTKKRQISSFFCCPKPCLGALQQPFGGHECPLPLTRNALLKKCPLLHKFMATPMSRWSQQSRNRRRIWRQKTGNRLLVSAYIPVFGAEYNNCNENLAPDIAYRCRGLKKRHLSDGNM